MAALVLFGGGGDLAMRMLLPSLYFLEHDGLLPDGLKIIGAARSDESREEYVAKVRAAVEGKAHADDAWSDEAWARLDARLDYLPVDATDPASLKPLKDKVGDMSAAGGVTSFLAVSPSLYGRIVTAIDMRVRLGLVREKDARPAMAVGIESKGESYGLLIDSVGEVLKLSPESREQNPINLDPRWARVSGGVHRLDGQLMVILDVDSVLSMGGEQMAA